MSHKKIAYLMLLMLLVTVLSGCDLFKEKVGIHRTPPDPLSIDHLRKPIEVPPCINDSPCKEIKKGAAHSENYNSGVNIPSEEQKLINNLPGAINRK